MRLPDPLSNLQHRNLCDGASGLGNYLYGTLQYCGSSTGTDELGEGSAVRVCKYLLCLLSSIPIIELMSVVLINGCNICK